tara:strand:+ start:475 stop:2100 length:1626 start_codon:yes stop_codon:yes gene_type:complete
MQELAQARYQYLVTDRQPFLDAARECSALTIPYLLPEDDLASGGALPIPWQSQGSRGVNVLSAKLMLSLFPINTSFFKLQINDAEIAAIPNVDAQVRSEIDLSLSKMEKMIMQQVAESSDRVVLHGAMKHLIVTGNVLLFAGKKNLKLFPMDRYVVNRDGDGTCIEIITKESIHRSLLPKEFQKPLTGSEDSNSPGEDGPKFGVVGGSAKKDDADVYTWAKLDNGQWKWHQEIDQKIVNGSQSSTPKKISPWLPLRWNVCDGESWGRSRCEEFIGDLKSLDGLMQSLVEGSASAAKVVFMVSPSATTKAQSLSRARNGSVIQGRADDVSVVNVGKTADFRTASEMIANLTSRLSDAFLILNPRQSERTTATEISALIQELNEQLGGIFGNLTISLLTPYLHRKLYLLSRNKSIPSLPKGLVMPTIVAGLNSVGRGQDKQSLMEFVTTIAQTMGPEALATYINPPEFLKRLAASSGIETLGLIKDPEQIQAENEQAQQQAQQQELLKQAGQLAKSPLAEQVINNGQPQQPTQETQEAPQAQP